MACQIPCPQCPWRRDTTKPPKNNGDIGGSDVIVYLAQAYGPFWLPCHMSKNYELRRVDPSKVTQCAGAAVFRANVDVDYLMPDAMLHLDADTDTVFASAVQMLARARNYSEEEARAEIRSLGGMKAIVQRELDKQCAFGMDLETKQIIPKPDVSKLL